MAKNKNENLGLTIHQTMDGDFFHITLNVIRWNEDGRIINAINRYGEKINGFGQFNNLQVSSQGNNGERDQLYAWEVRYRDVYAVELHDAKAMYETLSKITKAYEKLALKRGRPQSFGEYCGRFAEIIGADRFLFARSRRGTMHSDIDYTQYTVGEGVDVINHMVRMWQQRQEVA